MEAMLVIDMQVGCFEGQPPRHAAEAVVARINQLAQALRGRGRVIYIQHTDTEAYVEGGPGWALLPGLDFQPPDVRVQKQYCDAFLGTGLAEFLRESGVDTLYLTGCATDFCVDTTLRSAAGAGYKVVAVADAHTTRDRPHAPAEVVIAHHNWVWADLIVPKPVRVVNTETLLSEFQPKFPN